MHRVRDDARRKVSDSVGAQKRNDKVVSRTRKLSARRARRKRFSSAEIRDLSIASLLVVLVGISIFGNSFGIVNAISRVGALISSGLWWLVVGVIGLFLASFMAHELAHKFVSQHYGMWSEFRMTSMGYYLSAMAILFSIPIFGTGAVYTSGTGNREQIGKSNAAGPLTNFLIAASLAIISIVLSLAGILYPLGIILRYGVQLNAFLGLFNMIPIQPFDGATVRYWDNRIWIALTIGLIFMLILGYVMYPILGLL